VYERDIRKMLEKCSMKGLRNGRGKGLRNGRREVEEWEGEGEGRNMACLIMNLMYWYHLTQREDYKELFRFLRLVQERQIHTWCKTLHAF